MKARYLGIARSDSPADRGTASRRSELDDPRFADEFWHGEIEHQLQLKKKSEQQALAKYGLDFVTDTYLPEKLTEMGVLS